MYLGNYARRLVYQVWASKGARLTFSRSDRWVRVPEGLPVGPTQSGFYQIVAQAQDASPEIGQYVTEGSYRDAQGGWDGQHGWDLLPAALARLTSPETVARLVGLWALSALVQMGVGDQVLYGPAPVRMLTAQWTTRRLSIWARERLALTDPSGQLGVWLQRTLNRSVHRIAGAVPCLPRGEGYAQSHLLTAT